MTFMLECMDPSHRVTPTLVHKGYFSIPGTVLERLSVRQLTEWADENTQKIGCGHLGCTVSMADSLWQVLERQEICFYICKGHQPVDAQ